MADRMTTPPAAPVAPSAAAPARLDPFAAFRSEMDRLVESFFGKDRGPLGAFDAPDWFGGALSPSVEIRDGDAALVMTAELPGMAPEDVELTVRNGMLILSGEKKRETEEKKGDVTVSERRYGSFRRSFALPDDVDPDKASATFDKGVLTLTLPKKPEAAAGARRIAIR